MPWIQVNVFILDNQEIDYRIILDVTGTVYGNIVLIQTPNQTVQTGLLSRATVTQIAHCLPVHLIYIVGHHQVKEIVAFQVSQQPF